MSLIATQRKGDASRLTGPKAFPIERLLAIFECLLPEEQVDLAGTTDVYSEVCNVYLKPNHADSYADRLPSIAPASDQNLCRERQHDRKARRHQAEM